MAVKINISYDGFVGEMCKHGCSEPTAVKIWHGEYESFKNFNDNDISLNDFRKAADILKVVTEEIIKEI